MNFLLLEDLANDPARNKTGRSVLLIEPSYRNKYPPLGLMKLSAYHKELGDSVTFIKGGYSQYLLDEKYSKCMSRIDALDFYLEDKAKFNDLIKDYLKHRRVAKRGEILALVPNGNKHIVERLLAHYPREYQPDKKWDRVYITTLFTFYWKQTIEAIEFGKKVVKSIDSLYVGGVAASLIPDLFEEHTGLAKNKNIITGLLDKAGILDDNDIVIDEIIPDYSILHTIQHHYSLDTGYLTYMTKGCTRTCSFCAVPKLEPNYKEHISIREQIISIAKNHGERKDLILMDNNVLGSPKFPDIVQEILDLGFERGARFISPNQFEVLVNYLLKGDNDYNQQKYLKKIFEYLGWFGERRIKNTQDRERYYQFLQKNELQDFKTFTKEKLLQVRKDLGEFIEEHRNKRAKLRYVDFNQGIDCRYLNEENMELLSQLPIRPMRIAFDHIALKDQYEKAIRLANKYKVRTLSNYILFNYKDKPEHLWKRLDINLKLNQELDSSVYSFPMKYIPIYGPESTNRKFLGIHWHRKYIRAIQSILNATKGVVTVNPTFFYRAFGEDVKEYFKILMMPEAYIIYRKRFEENELVYKWHYQYKNLNADETKIADEIILSNNFSYNGSTPKTVAEVLKHYEPIRMSAHE